jgi:thiosulfate/3-mercaptopyruvate sulfurtransferase
MTLFRPTLPTPTLTAVALSLALAPGLALAAPDGWAPLLEPAELAALLDTHGDDIRVIHVSGDYAAGHIPGSGWSPYATWRGAADNPGALRDLDHLQQVVRDLGIESDTPVVVVHSGANTTDMGTAARVYWTLKSLGVQDLALLNGGFAGWTQAGLPVETAPASFIASDFVAAWRDDWRISTAEVAELAASGDARLLDARPRGFFEGLQWTIAAPGTIRGAGNLTYEDFFDGTRMLGAERVRDLATRHGFTDGALTVSFCNTGHWAAINWFALSELAEVPDTRLYAESMAEYAALDLPLDNAPNRVVYYWRATTRWVSDLF